MSNVKWADSIGGRRRIGTGRDLRWWSNPHRARRGRYGVRGPNEREATRKFGAPERDGIGRGQVGGIAIVRGRNRWRFRQLDFDEFINFVMVPRPRPMRMLPNDFVVCRGGIVMKVRTKVVFHRLIAAMRMTERG